MPREATRRLGVGGRTGRPRPRQADRGGADQRAVGAEPAGHDRRRRAANSMPGACDRARPGPRRRTASPKPRATEPATDREAQVEQCRHRRHGPPDEAARPARSSSSGAASAGSAGDRPRSRCPTPRPRGSPGRRTRTVGRRARRSRGRCGRRCRRRRRAAGRRARCRRRRRSTRPWRCSRARPAAAPRQPSPSASALASLSTCTSAGRARSASRPRSGKPRQPGMFSGDTCSPPRRHRPAAAHAAHDRVMATVGGRTRAPRRAGHRPASNSASASRPSVGTSWRRSTAPSTADQAGGQLGAADVDRERPTSIAATERTAATAVRSAARPTLAVSVRPCSRHGRRARLVATQETEAALGRPSRDPHRPSPTSSSAITRNIEQVIQGKPEVIELALLVPAWPKGTC